MFFALCLVIAFSVFCSPHAHHDPGINTITRERNQYFSKLVRGQCGPFLTGTAVIAASIFNFLVDVIIFFLPQRVIWNLQMSTWKKIGVPRLFRRCCRYCLYRSQARGYHCRNQHKGRCLRSFSYFGDLSSRGTLRFSRPVRADLSDGMGGHVEG